MKMQNKDQQTNNNIGLNSDNRIKELEHIIHLMENSRSWKLTLPMRKVGNILRKLKRILTLVPAAIQQKGGMINVYKLCYYKLKNGGIKEILSAIRVFMSRQQAAQTFLSSQTAQEISLSFLSNATKNPLDILQTRVLIIAEMSIPQCTKYRVIQKKELFNSLGIQCEIVPWQDYFLAKKQIALSTHVIFYRVYGNDATISLINECKRLLIPTFWEIDDLLFEKSILAQNRTVKSLPPAVVLNLYQDADLFKKALLACDYGIASTSSLALEMKKIGAKQTFIIENALDIQTIDISKSILLEKSLQASNQKIRIVYGSGTTAHNIDFLEVAPALAKILKEYNHVTFRLIGLLELPNYFAELTDKIERIEFCSYPEYLKLLSECDISIAPLENSTTNHAKSNIKYLEASSVKVASICSPLRSFTDIVEHNKNGLLANTEIEWYDCFVNLIKNKELREQLANQAFIDINHFYSPKYVAEKLRQAMPKGTLSQSNKPRLISFNIFYSPRSFGGATIVAEEINKLIQTEHNYEVYVVTALPVSAYLPPYSVTRYEHCGATVFGIAIPDSDMSAYSNIQVSEIIETILEIVSPNIAHFHSIQGLGVEIVELCHSKGIKTAVTLHDAWWICSQQFMIKHDGNFCHQYTLNKEACIKCAGSESKYLMRANRLIPIIKTVDYLIAPSSYSQKLYQSYIGRKPLLNKNGIKFPLNMQEKHKSKSIRFGYVGGNGPMKGFPLIVKAFRNYKFSDAKLIVVDNALNLGFKTFFDADLNGIENYEIVPAYTQETLDDFFDSIDVLLFPTQCKESFGLTVREAIVRNVWVISTDCGGPVDDIIEGINGNIIPFDSDYKQLANVIQQFINNYQASGSEESVLLEKAHISSFKNQTTQLIKIFEGQE